MTVAPLSAELEVRLHRLLSLWGQGEAAWRDPVLVNCLSRETSALDQIRPGASAAARVLFDQRRERSIASSPRREPDRG